jgi:3-phenylpropionate/cinnamic acid dioxygenase small subunit
LLTLSDDNITLLHSKLDDIDMLRSRTADITYDGYENSSGMHFSTNREITASEKNRLDIKLNFKQYEFNKELSMVFNVPRNYTRK